MLGDGETQRAVARLLGVGQATIARLAAFDTSPPA
jgi:predicted transcriptional regulator